jgi:hypothetical protein
MTLQEQTTSAQNRSRTSPLWRRAVRSIGWVLAGLVVLVLIWAGAQLALRRPLPELLFTDADLPKLPIPDENGWEVIKSEIPLAGKADRPDKEVAEICDGKATFEDRWARAEARAQKLSAVAQDEQTKKWLTVADKATLRPKFADACPIHLNADCPTPLQLLVLHQLQEAVVLHDSINNRWQDAFTRTTNMLRVDALFLPSARSTLTTAIARAQVHRAIKLVDVLLEGVAQEEKRNLGPDASALAHFAREIEPLLQNIREEDMDPMRVVVTEYLFSVYTIEHLTDSPQGRLSKGGSIFYNQGQTLELLNERFEQYIVYARGGGTGQTPNFALGRTWFLRNPIGHIALEALRGPIENHVPTIIKDRALLMQDKEALHNRLMSLKH